MVDIAGEAVNATSVGGTGSMKPISSSNDDLISFQAVELEADRLSRQGIITITLKHRESTSASRHVDLIQFVRLR